ncbi:glycosyltransferase family 4 protein [Desertivirga arenae]|uniref:glycosyltransferase family 4 protein n=1 Tax=Desertivirga arenae TaxID=2810309 RepID=UPI001A9793AC|nr:glycosyltransferase family 4 protein [Pedobacter sp. SYSU D00823]
MKRLAIVSTHPIQYYAPVFALLAKRVDLKVFYTWGEKSTQAKYDPGFGKVVKWDLPLLEGYDYQFLENSSANPGSHHYKGIQNPFIIEQITRFEPHAILVFGWAYSSHLKVLRHFCGKVEVWFRGDSNLIDGQKGLKAVLREIFLRFVYSKIDKAFFVGSANKEYFLRYGIKEQQLIFAPHAIDNHRFEIGRDKEVYVLKEKMGIKDDEVVILFAGKLEPKKDPELLLQAFMLLNRPNTHLLFVGNGILEKKLKKISDEWCTRNNNSRISFLDFQNQQMMPVVYQVSDLFCLPSKGPGETWGLAVNEAMASGKAVLVSSKVGCAMDLVHKENGAVFKSGDLMDLKDKLDTLCRSKSNLLKMGMSSRVLVQSWSFERQVEVFEKNLVIYGGQ